MGELVEERPRRLVAAYRFQDEFAGTAYPSSCMREITLGGVAPSISVRPTLFRNPVSRYMPNDVAESAVAVEFLRLVRLNILRMTDRTLIVTHAVPFVGPLVTAVKVIIQELHEFSHFGDFISLACCGGMPETCWPHEVAERAYEQVLQEPSDWLRKDVARPPGSRESRHTRPSLG